MENPALVINKEYNLQKGDWIMWQTVVVIIIAIAVVGKLGFNVYKFFFVKRDNNQPFCTGCSNCSPKKVPHRLKKDV